MRKYIFRFIFPAFFAIFFLLGCAVKVSSPGHARIGELYQLLYTLKPSMPKEETLQLSKEIFQKTEALTNEFEMTSPPQYHNFLVNTGLKEKGLCYHWADALYAHFTHKSYPSFEFHLMGANIGEYWTEHNVMAVAVKGMPAKEWIVIDPWRNPGKLYFAKVKDDHRYHWKYRPEREYQKGK